MDRWAVVRKAAQLQASGPTQENLASYCTQGRFQWQFIQPVYVGANQMQEYPPEGVNDPNTHDVVAYTHQLAERTSNGKIPPYDYAMSQIGHEMGHRWSAFVSAKVGGETIPLGPTHWARGLQAPVAFPYQRPTEASAMGGGVWQDNFDGTYTQLDDDYYVPATGWSYLDLYLMGLIAPSEVPDFFILRNLVPAGKDANGHPIFKADRTKVTIQDVIAVEGPRLPDVDHSQKKFNTGMVVVVEHGKTPGKELIERDQRHSPALDGLLGNHHRPPFEHDHESAVELRAGLQWDPAGQPGTRNAPILVLSAEASFLK